ncbi:hypothetical protein FHS96_001041 [Sphingomonas zeicaulis]|uniref:hypothetical protein n=1 Tax=Sphingomonas zeicaulis TaxID=1632740 RepID=UPI003D2551B1
MIEDAIEKQQAGLDLAETPRSTREQINAGIERGREAAGNLIASAQDHPWTTAAIAGGVVAAAAAATAGVVYLNRRRGDTPEDAGSNAAGEISAAARSPAYGIAAE